MEGWRDGGYKNFSRRSRSIAKKVFRLRSVEADQPASVFSRQSLFYLHLQRPRVSQFPDCGPTVPPGGGR